MIRTRLSLASADMATQGLPGSKRAGARGQARQVRARTGEREERYGIPSTMVPQSNPHSTSRPPSRPSDAFSAPPPGGAALAAPGSEAAAAFGPARSRRSLFIRPCLAAASGAAGREEVAATAASHVSIAPAGD